MKRSLLFFFILMLIWGCKDDEQPEEAPSSANPAAQRANAHMSGQTLSADFIGQIKLQNGSPVAGALVKIGGASAITDQRGMYVIDDVNVDSDYTLIEVEADGTFKQFRALKPKADRRNYVDIAMIPRVYNGFFTTANGGEVNVPGGGIVRFPAGALVNSAGQAYTGEVLVASTYLDPSDGALPTYMPGSLAAIDQAGQPVVMTTYGMFGVELASAVNNEPLQLANGRKATIEMQLPQGFSSHAPSEIPLWHFDEETGIWQEEGSATLVGNTYVGEVSHFSFWNCDIPHPHCYIDGSVVSNGNILVEEFQVWIIRPNGTQGVAYLSADGLFEGIIPANEVLTLEVRSTLCQETVVYETSIGPFTQGSSNSLDPIELSASIDEISFGGSVIDCDGIPMQDLLVTFELSAGYSMYTMSEDDGSFNFSLFCISQGSASVEIIDLQTQTFSNYGPVNFNLNDSESYTFGEVVFCEEESLPDYVTYNDGVNEITFEEIEFDPIEGVCSDLYAYNISAQNTDVVQGLQLNVEEAVEDSIFTSICFEAGAQVRGALSNGDFLKVVLPEFTYGYFSSYQSFVINDVTYINGIIELNNQNEAFNVEIYEDLNSPTPSSTYNTESIQLTLEVIY